MVELDKLAGDPVDVFVNDRLVARGEVLVLNDNFCVRRQRDHGRHTGRRIVRFALGFTSCDSDADLSCWRYCQAGLAAVTAAQPPRPTVVDQASEGIRHFASPRAISRAATVRVNGGYLAVHDFGII